MKKILLASIIAIGLQSCTPIYLVDKSEFASIPKGTKSIQLKTGFSSDSLFTLISRSFSRDGWVVKSDKGSMQISAEAKSVGSGSSLKPLVYIEGGSAFYSGEWGLDQQGQLMLQSFAGGKNTIASQPIIFEKSGTSKNDVAFQGLILLAKKVPGEITYLK